MQDPRDPRLPTSGIGIETSYVVRKRPSSLPRTSEERAEANRIARRVMDGTATEEEADRALPGYRDTLRTATEALGLHRGPMLRAAPDPGVSAQALLVARLDRLERKLDAIDAKLEEATRPEPFADLPDGEIIRDDVPLIEIPRGGGNGPKS